MFVDRDMINTPLIEEFLKKFEFDSLSMVWNLSARAREREWLEKDRKNLPSSYSFALIEFPDWRCHLQSGLWLVDSICNISMIFIYWRFLLVKELTIYWITILELMSQNLSKRPSNTSQSLIRCSWFYRIEMSQKQFYLEIHNKNASLLHLLIVNILKITHSLKYIHMI